ncbi:MAG: efflux RND transporter periplasmic adaptor subunit [Bdellovibrionales bacterium]
MKLFYSVIVLTYSCCIISHAYANDVEIIRTQLKPTNEARINSPMSGRITHVDFKDGESFKKGARLVAFDCSERRASLAQTQARIKRQSKLLEASQKLFDLGSASETDLSVLKAEMSEAKAARDFANAQVKKCTVSAPFSGKVAALSVKAHYSIQEGEPMIELVGKGSMQAQMIVPSKWMRWLKKGTKFQIEIDETGLKYGAYVSRLGGRVDPVTQSVKLYASIDDEAPELLTGMSGNAIFDHESLQKRNPEINDSNIKQDITNDATIKIE